ncbi:MAG TPA: hypothetical protein VG273_00555 [Bryobacteraceae bacterium]|jgi:hypothetical protein|nr:hypothetical protein [Bryobacteraceae bacterium]
MKFWLLVPAIAALAIAGIAWGAGEARVSNKSLEAVESMVNDKFRGAGPDPYDVLAAAHCTYLEGYGAITTVEIQLIYLSGVNPFRPAYSPQEIANVRERKLKKLPILRDAMRSLLAASATRLDSVPPEQRIALDASLQHFSWEDSRGIPQRLLMSGEKSKILAAQGSPAALAAAIEEQVQ